jgi:hypothetical protein
MLADQRGYLRRCLGISRKASEFGLCLAFPKECSGQLQDLATSLHFRLRYFCPCVRSFVPAFKCMSEHMVVADTAK